MKQFAYTLALLRQQARPAVLLLAVLAFGAQQWAERTHWHAWPAAAAVQAVSDSPADGSGRGHADCLWCHLASHAGAIAPPPPVPALLLAGTHAGGAVPVSYPADFIPPAAFAWHSRGPPIA